MRKKNILDLIDLYDAFLVDIYGVIFDGATLYPGVLSTLESLKKANKKIVIVSNSTQLAADVMFAFMQRGLEEGKHYDSIVTSGELLRRTLIDHINIFHEKIGTVAHKVKCMFMGNGAIFSDTPICKVDAYEDADFLYVGVPRTPYGSVQLDNLYDKNGNLLTMSQALTADWNNCYDQNGIDVLKYFSIQLESCKKLGKTLLVANPDIFVYHNTDGNSSPSMTQGAIGVHYQHMGGNVVYFGKPLPDIFEFAMQYVGSCRRIAMVGDTPWTDISGANNYGIESIMTITGIPQAYIQHCGTNIECIDDVLNQLFEQIAPDMSVTDLKDFKPNYILDSFSSI